MQTVATPNAPGKFLVLGSSSINITNLQDRLLRESILRKLLLKNYTIVSPMQIEQEQQESNFPLRSASPLQIKQITAKLKANYTLSGSLKFIKGVWIYKLSIYSAKNETFLSDVILIDEKENFFKFCSELSQKIIDLTIKKLKLSEQSDAKIH